MSDLVALGPQFGAQAAGAIATGMRVNACWAAGCQAGPAARHW